MADQRVGAVKGGDSEAREAMVSRPGGPEPGSYQRGGTDRVISFLRVFRAIIFRPNEFISFCFNYFHMYFQTVDGSPVVGSSLRHFGKGTGFGRAVGLVPSVSASCFCDCRLHNRQRASSNVINSRNTQSIRHSMRLVSLSSVNVFESDDWACSGVIPMWPPFRTHDPHRATVDQVRLNQ